MTPQGVYQFDIPDASIASGFSNGEKALTFYPVIDEVPPKTYYFLSRYLLLDGGNYTLKINGSDPYIFSIGSSNSTTRRVVSGDKSDGFPQQADFFVRGGRQRVDIQMYNVFLGPAPDPDFIGPGIPVTATPSTCYVAFSLWKAGKLVYASTADNWLWNDSWPDDNVLFNPGDVRLALPVWTTPPNWSGGVLETMTYDTEILTSESDAEQRRSLARNPRRMVECSFLRKGVQQQRINEFLAGVGSRKFLVPFWPEQWRMPHAMAVGDTLIYIDDPEDFATRELANGGVLLLSKDGDPSVYERFVYTRNVDSGGAWTLTLTQAEGGVTRAWPAGTRVTPLYAAYFDSVPTMQYVSDAVATVQLRFRYADTMQFLSPSWNYCAPLWRFPIDWSSPWNETNNRLASTLDTDIAPVDVFDYSGVTRIGQTLAITLKGRDAVANYRNFIAMARAKTVRFWMPSNHNDITPLGSTISGDTLQGKANGYSQWIVDPQDPKLMLAIKFKTGAPTVYRRVIYVSPGSNADVYTLEEALPTIDVDTISRISFVMPTRFDQDSFELNHVVDNCAVVTAAPVLMSAEIANMPPIECWVTSQPYPTFDSGSLQMSARMLNSASKYIPEGIQMSALVTAGSFPTKVTYGDYTMEPESMSMSALVTGGTIQEFIYTYGDYTVPPESINMTARVTNVSYPNSRISYTIQPEGLNMTAIVTSGTISS